MLEGQDQYDEDGNRKLGNMPSGVPVTTSEPEGVGLPPELTKKFRDIRKKQEEATAQLIAEKARKEAEIQRLAAHLTEESKKRFGGDAKALELMVVNFIVGGNVGEVGDYKISYVIGGLYSSARITASDNTLLVVRSGNPLNPVFLVNGLPGSGHRAFMEVLVRKLSESLKAWMYMDRSKMPFGEDLPPVITRQR